MKRIVYFWLLLNVPLSCFGNMNGQYRGQIYTFQNEDRALQDENLKVLALELWKSSLQDAQKSVGPSPIQEITYTTGHSDSQLCYTGSNITVLLNSPFDRDKALQIQTAIVTTDKQIKEKMAACTSSPLINQRFRFMGGLRMGMSRADVKRVWGTPGKITPTVMIYEIRRTDKQAEAEGAFTDDVSIYLEFKRDRLTFAQLSRTIER